jgi:hypothetical protein
MANAFLTKLSKNIGTTAVQVGGYTPGTGASATLIGMTVGNNLLTVISVDVLFRRGGVDHTLVKGANIAVGGGLVPIGGDQKIVLEPGDAIYVRASAAAAADVTMSILEISP